MASTNTRSEEQEQLLVPPDEETKAKRQRLSSMQQIRLKERNIVSVKAKKDQPKFIYSRVYVSMRPGNCVEYNLSDDTSLLTRDRRFEEFMDRPYAVIPQGDHKLEEARKAYHLISPKWTGFRAGWLESQTETYNIFRVDRYAAWSGLVPDDLKEELDLSPRYSSLKLQDGNCLVGNDIELEDAWKRISEYVSNQQLLRSLILHPI